MCRTPNGREDSKCHCYYNNFKSNDPKLVDDCDQRVTEWQMIVPISSVWDEVYITKTVNESSSTDGVFGSVIENARTNYIQINLDDIIFNDVIYYSTDEKIKRINMISERIAAKAYPNCIFDLNDSILHIDAVKYASLYSIELLAKAIVHFVINAQNKSRRIYESTTEECRHSSTSNLRIRAALVLSGVDTTNELVRFYSTAYIDNELPEMNDVQIAVCSNDKLGNKTVDYILAGKDLSAVFKSAISSSYYDSAHTFSCLPVLNYIARRIVKEAKTNNCPALFPFDLYLKTDSFISHEQYHRYRIDPWRDTWFIKRTSDILNREMQSDEYVCTINNIHIRIGSKIHLEKFVEGQLLFRDSYNVDRFAYLVAYDLLKGDKALDSQSAVLLAGYKAYSAHFIEQVAFWLRHAFGDSSEERIHTAIIKDGDKDGDVCVEMMSDESKFIKLRAQTINVITLLR